MSDDQQKIMSALHDHDRRLVAVETEVRGIHNEIRDLKAAITSVVQETRGVAAKMDTLGDKVGELTGTQRMLLWILGAGIPLLVMLEAWAVFRA